MAVWSGEWYYRGRGGSWRNRRTGETTGHGATKREVTGEHPYNDDRYARSNQKGFASYKKSMLAKKSGSRPKLKEVNR